MRSSIEFRLSLTDEEWSKVAMSAFRAHKPLNQWIKEQILVAATEPQSLAPAASEAESFTEPAPAPIGAVEDLVQLRQDAVPAALPAPAEAEAAAAAPAPAPEPPVAPKAKPASRKPTPSDIIPEGFESIVSIGEKIVAAQAETRRTTGAKAGISYNNVMSQWYARNGLAEIPIHVRTPLIEVGRRAADLRRWYAAVPPGTVPEAVRPYALLKLFERTPASGRPASTLVFGRNHIERVPVSEAIGRPTGTPADGADTSPADTPPADTPPAEPQEPAFTSFAEVELDKLPDDDRRSVRRFAERILNLGGPKDLAKDKIAIAIRNLRGKDSSGTPKIARDLVRLGVLSGSSGDFWIRREFTDRFTDVVQWAAAKH